MNEQEIKIKDINHNPILDNPKDVRNQKRKEKENKKWAVGRDHIIYQVDKTG